MAFSIQRADAVDAQFLHAVKQGQYPDPVTLIPSDVPLETFWSWFITQCESRHIDFQGRRCKEEGECHYTISSAGHEGNAAVAAALRREDMAFLHYRSQAFHLQRAKDAGQDALMDMAQSLLSRQSCPISGGRHKVIGSVDLNIPPQTSTIASHLPKAVGYAFGLSLHHDWDRLPKDRIAVVSTGDASFNHSTTQGSLNATRWMVHQGCPMPLLYVIEDNQWGISVPTPSDWIALQCAQDPLWGYEVADGRNLLDVFAAAKRAIRTVRVHKRPVFLHLKTVRLMGHAGSDVETTYRSERAILATEARDPLLQSAYILHAHYHVSAQAIVDAYQDARSRVESAVNAAKAQPVLTSREAVMQSLIPTPASSASVPPRPSAAWENSLKNIQGKTLAQLINLGLQELMETYSNSVAFGEDVGKKGGVYHVTAQLQKRFGPARVFDTLLDEQTILGTAQGLSLHGFLPIPEIQFMAYLHNAIDQIRSEAATLPFFSNAQLATPMVLRLPGLAYQKGFGGHFHNENTFAALRDIPGLMIACPSSGKRAVKLLREAFYQAHVKRRVVVFLEPIALYHRKDGPVMGDALALEDYPEADARWRAETFEHDKTAAKTVIVSFGNGAAMARWAQAQCQDRKAVDTIDLGWVHPIDWAALADAVRSYKDIIIVDECRQTASLSEAIVTQFTERAVPGRCHRLCGADTFIPTGPSWGTVLPSLDALLDCIDSEHAVKERSA